MIISVMLVGAIKGTATRTRCPREHRPIGYAAGETKGERLSEMIVCGIGCVCCVCVCGVAECVEV